MFIIPLLARRALLVGRKGWRLEPLESCGFRRAVPSVTRAVRHRQRDRWVDPASRQPRDAAWETERDVLARKTTSWGCEGADAWREILPCVTYADTPLNSCTAHSSSNLYGDSNRTGPPSWRCCRRGTECYRDRILPDSLRRGRKPGYSRRLSRAREPLTPLPSSVIVDHVAVPHLPARSPPLLSPRALLCACKAEL